MFNASADMLNPKLVQKSIIWIGLLGIGFILFQYYRLNRQAYINQSKFLSLCIVITTVIAYSMIVNFYTPFTVDDMFDDSKFDYQCADIKKHLQL